jgi:hypothetical protein
MQNAGLLGNLCAWLVGIRIYQLAAHLSKSIPKYRDYNTYLNNSIF